MKRMQLDARDRSLIALTLFPPFAWFGLLVIGWNTVPGAHEYGRVTILRLLALGAALITIVCGALAWREIKLSTGDQDLEVLQRRRFLAVGSFVLCVFTLLLVIATAIPMIMLPPGAEP